MSITIITEFAMPLSQDEKQEQPFLFTEDNWEWYTFNFRESKNTVNCFFLPILKKVTFDALCLLNPLA